MARDPKAITSRLNHLFNIATNDRKAVRQNFFIKDGVMDAAKISKMKSGKAPIGLHEVEHFAHLFSTLSLKVKSGIARKTPEYIMNFLWEGADPEKLFVTHESSKSLGRLNLSELAVFQNSRSPLFEEVPVSLSPAAINEDNLEPLWTFHEDTSGKTNKLRVKIVEGSLPILNEDDIDILKATAQSDRRLPEKDRSDTIREVEKITEKSNPYLRLRSLELSELDKTARTSIMTLRCEPSDYQVGALKAVINRLGDSASELKTKLSGKNVHNLAVRVALVSLSPKSLQQREKLFVDNEREIILHRRTHKVFTYRRAWDVSAAGYIDRIHHLSEHDELRIDVSKAARAEINEELGVPSFLLPTEEHFEFFGLTQNIETGQVDIVGQVHVDKAKFDQIWRAIKRNEAEVEDVKRIKLRPEEIARFLDAEGVRIVPSALATILLALRHAGFTGADIISELRSAVDRVHLDGGFAAYD